MTLKLMTESVEGRAKWYQTPVARPQMKQLVQRTDHHGLIYTVVFFTLVFLSGYLANSALGSWWAIPAFAMYGGIWVFATSVVHETSHGTAFKTRWINELILFVSGLMVQQIPTGLRWTHARHHSETAMVGKDVEIVLTNPLSRWRFLLVQLCDLGSVYYYLSRVWLIALGRLDDAHQRCVPDTDVPRLVFEARIFLSVYLAIIGWAIAVSSWWPVVMFLLPRVFGAPVHGVMLATQHIGFAQNRRDHRQTTRTTLMNPVLRLLYWNMNYHVEHHMFPSVPFHQLPVLHQKIRHDIVPPTPGIIAALVEMFDTVKRQQSDTGFSYPKTSATTQ